MRFYVLSVIATTAFAAPCVAEKGADILVIGPALPGIAIDPTHIPTAIAVLDAAALSRGGTTSLLRTLGSDLPSVTLQDAQANPYQPNLLYRGYAASALGGGAQGLAIYVDRTRFNQPCGDIANWDLIPDIAVDRVTLEGSNPIFGLNALGAAIGIDLKTGRSFSGAQGEFALGRFGKRQIAAETGFHENGWSAYIAGSRQHDDGWRDFSPSTVQQLYLQIGVDGAWGNLDLRLMGADTNLAGNGTAPVELLAVRRKSVFSYPDATHNSYGRALLTGDIVLSQNLHLRPSVYFNRFRQQSANGDLSEAAACDGDPRILCLSGAADMIVTGMNGAPFVALNADHGYGQLNRAHTQTNGYGVAVQLDYDEAVFTMPNSVSLGASYDGSRSSFEAVSLLGVLQPDRGFGMAQGAIEMVRGPIHSIDIVTRRDDIGIYAADVLTILPNVDVTIAARFNHTRVALHDRIGTALSGVHHYDRLNPSAGIVWRAGEGITLYGGYAEANRAPTPAELSCADPAAPCSLTAFFVSDPDLKQVVARTFEAGVRGSQALGGMKLNWRIGGWRAINANDIVFAASDTRGRAFFRNAGKTKRQGFETELTAIAGPWTLQASYALTDATYRVAFLTSAPDNPAADADGRIAVFPGDRLPGIARNRFKSAITRRFGKSAWLSFDGQYSSGVWLQGDEANLTMPTRDYWFVNLSASVKLMRQIEMFAEVHNLFDRDYETFGSFSDTSAMDFQEAPGITDPRSLSPAAPRTWLVGARVQL